MPPPSDSASLHLRHLEQPLYLYKIPPSHDLNVEIFLKVTAAQASGGFASLTVIGNEINVILDEELDAQGEGVVCSKWGCISIVGPLDLSNCAVA
jgi:hypothetical protein